jgi:hypothetical protein
MRPRFSASAGEEKIILSDTGSSNIHHYEYISSPNVSTLPELPARPTQPTSCENRGKLHVNTSPKSVKSDLVKSADFHIGDDLKEPCLYISNELYEEHLHIIESDGNKSHYARAETPEDIKSGEK